MRYLLCFVFSFGATAQIQGQRLVFDNPVIIKNETPPPSLLLRAIEVGLPAGVAVLAALAGAYLTNRQNNQRLREQRQWELKKDLLVRLAQTLVQTHHALMEYRHKSDYFDSRYYDLPELNDTREEAEQRSLQAWNEYRKARADLAASIAASSLVLGGDIRSEIDEVAKPLRDRPTNTDTLATVGERIQSLLERLNVELQKSSTRADRDNLI